MVKRKLYISIEETISAFQTKETAEAYIFALMIKASTISARINNPTIRNLKSILHIGNTKCVRALKNALAYDYVRFEGKSLVANILKNNKDNIRPIFFEKATRKQDGSLNCSVSFRNMEKLIREQVIINQVKQQNLCEKTYKAVSDGIVDGVLLTANQIKTYRRRKNRLSHTEKFHKGLSLAKVMSIIHSSRYAACKLMRGLVLTGKLIKEEILEDTGIAPNNFGRNANKYMREIGFGGYFLYRDGKIVCQRSNVYVCSDNFNSKYYAK